jgi:hypothetical protein
MQIVGMKRRERQEHEDPRTVHHQREYQEKGEGRRRRKKSEIARDARSKITFAMETGGDKLEEEEEDGDTVSAILC